MKCFYRYAATVLALLLIATSGMLVTEATAQSAWGSASPDQQDERTQYESPRADDPAGTGVPDWADSGSSGDFQRGSEEPIGFGPEMNQGPGLPGDPPQVPVDGGLSLLALAGAGYAARKLRNRDDEGESDDMP